MTSTVDDWRPNQSLADDPAFLASLGGLDSGLAEASITPARHEKEPATAAAPGRASAPTAAQPPPSPQQPPPDTAARRPSVLELFPATEVQPATRARPVAHPARPPAPPAARRIARVSPPAAGPKPYVTFYSLQEEPFNLAPDPRFFYHSATHDDGVQELLTAIRRREGVVLVTGAPGSGKTTLCRTVVEHLDRRTLACFVAAADTFDELVRAALVGFGVIAAEELERKRPQPADLLVTLREFLLSLAGLQAFAVLFIDDAGTIPSSVLREISVLADTGADQRLLEIVLVGDERLVRKLGRGELKPLARQITLRCALGVLAPEEIPGYVVHRLMIAAPNPRVEFGDDAFARLAELTGGIPRLINVLCDRALEEAAASGQATVDATLIDAAAGALGIEAPESPLLRALRTAALVAALLAFVAVGAGAAAFVFQDRLTGAVHGWQQVPPAPRKPVLPKPGALAPLPVPDGASGTAPSTPASAGPAPS